MLRRSSSATLLVGAILVLTTTAFAQTANFTSDVTQGCFPLTVNFTDTSTGGPTSWLWDFGNGNTSILQNPSAVFSTPGVYDVSLKVSNGGAPSTRIRAGYIVVHDFPIVDFSFDVSSGCAPLAVKFKDQTSTASGQIVSWFWVFGDGGTSTAANPTYVFKQPGSRTVTLRVRNQHGCEKVKSTTSPIVVLGPDAKFTADKTAICTTPATFTFTNQSTGNNLTYSWNFGDGQTSTLKDPVHTYNSAGTFKVVMKARDANSCEQSFEMSVNAGSEGGLDFSASTFKVCLGSPIDFKLVSTDAAVTQTWNFGNGNTSTSRDPQFTYAAPGTYTVTLSAELLNHTCNSVVKKTVLVAQPAIPTFTSKIDCSYNVTLSSTSTNTSRVEWYLDGELVSSANSFISPVHAPGTQAIKLIAYDAADCGYVLESGVFVSPNPSVSFDPTDQQSCSSPSLSGCAPFSIPFTNTSTSVDPVTYRWEFGDGASATTTNAAHTYVSKGLYQVTLTATNTRGCSSSATSFVIVSNVVPVADFEIDKHTACAGEPVTFTDKSQNADFWCWDFGDGVRGEGKTISHKYQKPGTYSVKLTAKNAGCKAEKVLVNTITIKDPFINYAIEKTCLDPYSISLTNTSKNYDEIHWEFGDGQTSTDPHVGSHHYDHEGLYVLQLIGTNFATGCTTIAFTPVLIQEVKANFDVNTDKPCKGAPLLLTDKSTAAVKWEWTVGSFSSGQQNASTKMNVPGAYTARLKVTDSDGCEATASRPINVLNMEGNFTYQATSNCDEFTVAFDNKSSGTPPPTVWQWDFGDGDTSTDKNPVHVYTQTGDYNVNLSVTNSDGTCVFAKDNAVVFTNPVPDFEIAKHDFCPGDVVVIANTSKDALTYEWDYGDGRRSDFISPSIPYTEEGSYDITLFARDAFGCERKLTETEYVVVDKPSADFSVASASGACPPFTAIFKDQSHDDIVEWKWNFGDGKNSILQNPANVYLEPGQFNVSLTVTDDNGCVDTRAVNRFVSVGGPTGSFTSDGADQCANQTISFVASVANTKTLRWDFGDGTVLEENDNEVSHAYASTGSFTPTLLLIDALGCQNVADGSSILQVKDTTLVSVLISPSCIHTGEPFRMEGRNEGDDKALMWSWTINGQVVGNGEKVQAMLEEPGLYTVVGRALNQFNCTSNVVDTVRIQGPIGLIPNVITPNDDGKNDRFRIIGLENSIWNLDVLNRWGNPVLTRKDYRGDWDGNEQPAGVYYYVLRNAICEEKDYKGFISIVR